MHEFVVGQKYWTISDREVTCIKFRNTAPYVLFSDHCWRYSISSGTNSPVGRFVGETLPCPSDIDMARLTEIRQVQLDLFGE
jgi:hypothetical protein